MAAETITARPAAGPETPSGEPLKAPTRIPPKMPAINPEKSGAPLASAIPKHRGTATKNTTIPAGKSSRKDWYDGVNKHLTEIGDNVFVGSNSSLVAPVKIGEGATIGAGPTLQTHQIPEESPSQVSALTYRINTPMTPAHA